MDIYMQAARAMQGAIDGKGQLKRLCLQKDVQKKRATYAVAAETTKAMKVLDEILKTSGFYESNPTFWPCLARVMAYDVIFGTGLKGNLKTGQGYAVKKHSSKMKRTLEEIMRKKKVDTPAQLVQGSGSAPRIPVYVRVNTCVTTVDEVIKRLAAEGWKQLSQCEPKTVLSIGPAPASKRGRTPDAPEVVTQGKPGKKKRKLADGTAEDADDDKKKKKKSKKKAKKEQEAAEADPTPDHDGRKVFYRDPILTSLLVFPPYAKFTLVSSAVVKTGQVVIQDKASCLPPYLLLHCLEMQSLLERNSDKPSIGGTHLGPVMDATAAPGNKTTLLAALSRNRRPIYAVERDEERAATLKTRLTQLKVGPKVEVLVKSFLDVDPLQEPYCKVEGILLDPSCSGSGIVDRIEPKSQALEDKVKRQTEEKDRLVKLADFQTRMLLHAAEFPNIRRVVYSTCSIHREENEDVVSAFLSHDDIKGKWGVADIMPGTWATRALPVFQDAQHCIRCTPQNDATNGFFVAVLERIPKKKKKNKKKKAKQTDAESDDDDDAEEPTKVAVAVAEPVAEMAEGEAEEEFEEFEEFEEVEEEEEEEGEEDDGKEVEVTIEDPSVVQKKAAEPEAMDEDEECEEFEEYEEVEEEEEEEEEEP